MHARTACVCSPTEKKKKKLETVWGRERERKHTSLPLRELSFAGAASPRNDAHVTRRKTRFGCDSTLPPLLYGLVSCILVFVLEKKPTGGHVPYSSRRSQPSSIGRSLPSVSRDTTTGVEISANTCVVLRDAECSGRCGYFGLRKRHVLCLVHAVPVNQGEGWNTPRWLPRSRRLRPVRPTAPAWKPNEGRGQTPKRGWQKKSAGFCPKGNTFFCFSSVFCFVFCLTQLIVCVFSHHWVLLGGVVLEANRGSTCCWASRFFCATFVYFFF